MPRACAGNSSVNLAYMPYNQRKELPASDRMYIREKLRNRSRRSNEPDSFSMVSVETVMLGALSSCVALAAIGSQLG